MVTSREEFPQFFVADVLTRLKDFSALVAADAELISVCPVMVSQAPLIFEPIESHAVLVFELIASHTPVTVFLMFVNVSITLPILSEIP